MNALLLTGTILGALLVAVALIFAIRRYRSYTATRVITCPETGDHEAVHLDAGHGLGEALRGHHDLKLASCSRWPERQDCGQGCLSQIESAPDGCLIRDRLDQWYADKRCVLCGKEFGPHIEWWNHRPALMDDERRIKSWSEIAPQELPDRLETDAAVCWDCQMVETVYREHPERVTERPGKWAES